MREKTATQAETVRRKSIKSVHLPRLFSHLVQHQGALVVLVTLILLGGFYFYNLDGWLIDDDEGSFLYQAWRISEGEQPYTDFFSTRWPFFLHTTGWLVKLLGQNPGSIRAVPILLTLITALVTFLLAREILPIEGAWIALVGLLLFPPTFRYGRRLYTEAFMLFFDLLGLYLFYRGWKQSQRLLLVLAGLCFGTAAFFQPMGILSFAGCVLWMLAQLWQHRQQWRQHLQRSLPLLLAFGFLSGAVATSLAIWTPEFYWSAIGTHLAEGTKESMGASNGIAMLVGYVLAHIPLMAFALPAARFSRTKSEAASLLAWQLPTALAFLALSRALFARYLYYLSPALVILLAMAVDPLRHRAKRSLLLLSILCAIFVPWLVTDLGQALQTEENTNHVVDIIRSETDTGDYVLSDYQELNYHAQRRSTYQGAEISGAMIEQGQITSEQLIREIEKYDVKMVIIDVSPGTGHHLVTLPDYGSFTSYLDKHFESLGQWPRSAQTLSIYVRD